jgi:Ni2+-binding GTPase involved in maturation of urease and hydrogenase
MLGGFLGAGKTTTISRLARRYTDQGLRVAIVTNDQAADLVDTSSLRAQGFSVGEVAGSCFCCNFHGLTAAVEQLARQAPPDVILAEPVGSCTDLVATVLRPLAQAYGPFDVAPYGVLVKPSHGARILRNQPSAGFSPQAAYIFHKQLEEADFLVINRIDELPVSEVQELAGLLTEQHPGRPIVRMSARTGEGFATLCELLEERGTAGRQAMEVDYDVYAAGEAELGWLNGGVRVSAETPFPLDDLLLDIIERLRTALADSGAEPAHLKTIGLGDGFHGVANLVSSFTLPELSLPSRDRVRQAQLVVNARVACDPAELERHVRIAVSEACASVGATAEFVSVQSFRPGRPVPTYRIAALPL